MLPENMLAIAAIKKLRTTPGPAIVLATMPATRYIPVPQHEPTPSDVRSNVVRHFCEMENEQKPYTVFVLKVLITICSAFKSLRMEKIGFTVSLGFVLRGSSPCTERKSLVRTNLENNVRPVPPPGIGIESFIFAEFVLRCFLCSFCY